MLFTPLHDTFGRMVSACASDGLRWVSDGSRVCAARVTRGGRWRALARPPGNSYYDSLPARENTLSQASVGDSSFYSVGVPACSATEVLVLALLLMAPGAVAAAREWAADALTDAGDYVAGAPWTVPPAWYGARQHVHTVLFGDGKKGANDKAAMLRGLSDEVKQGAVRAAALYDGPGGTAAPYPVAILENYIKALGLPRVQRGALFGLGLKKDPPLRKMYILPRVARLVRDRGDELAALMTRGIDAAHEFGVASGAVPGHVVQSPLKAELKAKLARAEDALAEAQGEAKRQKRVRGQAVRRAAATRRAAGARAVELQPRRRRRRRSRASRRMRVRRRRRSLRARRRQSLPRARATRRRA